MALWISTLVSLSMVWASIHTDIILKNTELHDFYELLPNTFQQQNKRYYI